MKSQLKYSRGSFFIGAFIFGLFATILSLILIQEYDKINQATKSKGIVLEIRELNFLDQKYRVQLINNNGQKTRVVTAESNQLTNFLIIGDSVEVALLNSKKIITGAWIWDYIYKVLIFLWTLPVLYFLCGILPRGTPLRSEVVTALIAMVTIIFCGLGSLIYYQQAQFEKNSIPATGRITDYKVSTCEDEDDNKYTCYSRIITFTANDGKEYSFSESIRSGNKMGHLNQEKPIRYLEANPNSAQLIQRWVLDLISFSLFLIGLLILYFNIKNKHRY